MFCALVAGIPQNKKSFASNDDDDDDDESSLSFSSFIQT